MAATVSPLFLILPAFATLIVGLIAALIAYQQWRLSHNKLKLDLFEKRYKVYGHFRKFIQAAVSDPAFSPETFLEFKAETADVIFLFGSEVVAFRNQINQQAMEIRKFAVKSDHLKNTKIISDSDYHKHYDEIDQLNNQLTRMEEVFAPYLSFADLNDHSAFDRLVKSVSKEIGPII